MNFSFSRLNHAGRGEGSAEPRGFRESCRGYSWSNAPCRRAYLQNRASLARRNPPRWLTGDHMTHVCECFFFCGWYCFYIIPISIKLICLYTWKKSADRLVHSCAPLRFIQAPSRAWRYGQHGGSPHRQRPASYSEPPQGPKPPALPRRGEEAASDPGILEREDDWVSLAEFPDREIQWSFLPIVSRK